MSDWLFHVFGALVFVVFFILLSTCVVTLAVGVIL